MPEVVVKGLTSSDDPLWLPNIGLIFSESQANRIVRLDERDQPVTFIGDLLNPLGMTVDGQGQIISIATKPGSMGPRVVWPKGKERSRRGQLSGQGLQPSERHHRGQERRPVLHGPAGHARCTTCRPAAPIIRVADKVGRPNGLQLSRDEKHST